MSLQRAYHHLSEEKRAAIMALAREGFSGAHIARHCGISGATVSSVKRSLNGPTTYYGSHLISLTGNDEAGM